MGPPKSDERPETYNPWSIVHLVFEHLSDQGLHPTLGDGGSPARPRGGVRGRSPIEPAAEGNREVVRAVRAHLAEIRPVMLEEPGRGL